VAGPDPADASDHTAAVQRWWAARDERLRDPDGWLTLVGLHWLKPGENRFGAHPANDIVLHGPHVPPRAGSLWLRDGRVRLSRTDAAVPEQDLADDAGGNPTGIDLGDLRMHLIRRGDRIGLRVRDRASPALRTFAGMRHFPFDPSWRVVARLEAAPDGEEVEIVDVTGRVSREATPGHVAFERDGRTWRLAALPGDDDGSLWLLFGDATNGGETYGGGRFLYTEPVAPDGSVAIDFNLAYNPPCVFSPHATCPLPPPENRLDLRVTAGELDYPG
jgi:uncharacterized protein (DUF1684 family)